MSYNVYLETPKCPACGRATSSGGDFNMTSNVSGIWCRALCKVLNIDFDAPTSDERWRKGLGGFFPLEGMPGDEAAKACMAASIELTDNAEAYRHLQPDNGWGTVESARDFLRKIGEAWIEMPKAEIRVSR